MTASDNLTGYIQRHRAALDRLMALSPETEAAAQACITALRGGGNS